ncbi:MAG: sigma 54-interacting transcriptional regulator, partial [Burkholderiales bacterium]
GAFTGAQTMRRGRFEQADGGTLFLDEIGDMPADLQTRLLRVLSDGHFYRVGGHNPVKTNVRVIAATHQDLEQRVKEGIFREDLFHRLNVIRLRLPALRERREDVAALTRHFLSQSARQLGVEPKRIANAAIARIERFAFPGNVRQLENMCHWLTVMAPAQMIEVKDLPPELGPVAAESDGALPADADSLSGRSESAAVAPSLSLAQPSPASARETHAVGEAWPAGDSFASGAATESASVVAAPETGWEDGLEAEALALLAVGRHDVWDVLSRRFEARLIQAALASTRGRRIEAAQKLGIGRNTITRKIQELGLE